MTSSSLRKHPITRSSTPAWTRAETLRTAGAAAVMLLACASAAFGGRNSGAVRTTAATTEASAVEDDPLARLRQRDARKRWGADDPSDEALAPPPPQGRAARKANPRVSLELGNENEGEGATSDEETFQAPPVPDQAPAVRSAAPRKLKAPPRRDARGSTPRSNPQGWREDTKTDPGVQARGAAIDFPDDFSDSGTGEVGPRAARRRSSDEPAEDAGVDHESTHDAVRSHGKPAQRPVARRPVAQRPSASNTRPPESEDSQEVDLIQPPPAPRATAQHSQSFSAGRRTTQATLASRPRTITVAQTRSNIPADPIRDPRMLPKISSIQPFFDYEPDPERLKDDRCHNLCPRPRAGCPDCKKNADGTVECPDCPEEVQLSKDYLGQRNFGSIKYCWRASDLWNYPLYFEDFELERYGHTRGCLQPLWSVGKFGVQLFGLPYQMTIDPICKKRYSLGYYRPGACVPAKYYQIPWNPEAALVEAGVVTGGYYIFAP